MPIDRAPWNALVDDDGSNLVGTVWNKDKIKTTILDPADVAYAKTVLFPSTTGTANDWNPGIVGNTIVRCNAASLLTITGLAPVVAPFNGQVVRLVQVGVGQVDFLNYQSSSAGRRLANVIAGARSLAGNSIWASIDYQYVSADGIWVVRNHNQGAPITAPYSAASFTATAPMTWTVEAADLAVMCYLLEGTVLTVYWQITGASIGGTPTTILNINSSAFGGHGTPRSIYNTIGYLNYSGIITQGFAQVVGQQIQLLRWDGGAFAVGTNNMYTYGQIAFPVV